MKQQTLGGEDEGIGRHVIHLCDAEDGHVVYDDGSRVCGRCEPTY